MQPTTPAVPQILAAVNNPQRQVEMTGLPQNSDSYDGMGIESGAPVSDSERNESHRARTVAGTS